MDKQLVQVICEIIAYHPRVTLFSVISLAVMFFVIAIESIGLTTWITDMLSVLIVVVAGISLGISYMYEEIW